jgi:hypothetical protein
MLTAHGDATKGVRLRVRAPDLRHKTHGYATTGHKQDENFACGRMWALTEVEQASSKWCCTGTRRRLITAYESLVQHHRALAQALV